MATALRTASQLGVHPHSVFRSACQLHRQPAIVVATALRTASQLGVCMLIVCFDSLASRAVLKRRVFVVAHSVSQLGPLRLCAALQAHLDEKQHGARTQPECVTL